MEAWKIIQQCEINGERDQWSKDEFILRLEGMTREQFNLFCKDVLLLRNFYEVNLDHSIPPVQGGRQSA
jgi:hypothetical protein